MERSASAAITLGADEPFGGRPRGLGVFEPFTLDSVLRRLVRGRSSPSPFLSNWLGPGWWLLSLLSVSLGASLGGSCERSEGVLDLGAALTPALGREGRVWRLSLLGGTRTLLSAVSMGGLAEGKDLSLCLLEVHTEIEGGGMFLSREAEVSGVVAGVAGRFCAFCEVDCTRSAVLLHALEEGGCFWSSSRMMRCDNACISCFNEFISARRWSLFEPSFVNF